MSFVSSSHLQSDLNDPLHDALVGPDDNIPQLVVAVPPPGVQRVSVVVQHLQGFDPILERRAVKTVHQFQLGPEVLLSKVVEHPGVHQALHERCAVLGETLKRRDKTVQVYG